VQNVVSQTTQTAQQQITMDYGKPFDGGRTKAQKQQFADAKAMLENAPDAEKRAWSKVAPDLKEPIFKGDAYYKGRQREVHFKSYAQAFEESSYQRKNTVFFHEYGHNVDHALGGFGGVSDYLSVSYNGGSFGKMIEQECAEALQAFHANSGMTEAITDRKVCREFAKWMKGTYNIYERGDISDMFERYMVKNYGIQFPFGVGHGSSYHADSRNTPLEAFAEMFSATVTNNDSLPVIQKFFPKSYKIFEEMLGSVI
jgi:hypothetical protein